MQADAGALQAEVRLKSLLTLALEELPDVPLYYNVHDLCKILKAVAPSQDAFRSALVNAGRPPSGRWSVSKDALIFRYTMRICPEQCMLDLAWSLIHGILFYELC